MIRIIVGFGRSVDLDKNKAVCRRKCRFGLIIKIMEFGRSVDLDSIRKKIYDRRSVDLE